MQQSCPAGVRGLADRLSGLLPAPSGPGGPCPPLPGPCPPFRPLPDLSAQQPPGAVKRPFPDTRAPGRALTQPGARQVVTGSLLDGDRRAGPFQGGPGLLRGLLVDPLQERLGRGVHEVLGLLEAQAGLEGRAGKRARGGHIGGSVPYGYRKVVEGRGAMLEPDEAEQAIVASIKNLRASGCAYREMIELLTARGVMLRSGKPWTNSQLHRVLHANHRAAE